MANEPIPVIDLTNSFTLVNTPTISEVINLDDSYDNNESQQLAQRNVRVEAQSMSEADENRPLRRNRSRNRTSIRNMRVQRVTSQQASPDNNDVEVVSIDLNLPTPKQIAPDTSIIESSLGPGDCPICLVQLCINPTVSTICGHVFCKVCLEKALSIDKKCPKCRKVLRGKNAYHSIFLYN